MSGPLPSRSSVRALLLDAGGVLIRPRFSRVEQVLRAHGVTADGAALARLENRAKRLMDQPSTHGAATDEERAWLYFDFILREAGIDCSPATDAALAELKAWHDRDNIWDEVLPGVPEALACFRRLGLRLAVVSNANGTVPALMQRLRLLPLFDAVLDSAIEGVEKPDPRIFEIALDRLGADRDTAVHVGDMYEVDVVGARAAGLRAVLLDAENLYPEADCPRVRSLTELATHLAASGGRS